MDAKNSRTITFSVETAKILKKYRSVFYIALDSSGRTGINLSTAKPYSPVIHFFLGCHQSLNLMSFRKQYKNDLFGQTFEIFLVYLLVESIVYIMEQCSCLYSE